MTKMNSVEKLRTALDLSQSDFAEKLGVHQGTVCRMEQGAKPSKPVQKLLDQLSGELAKSRSRKVAT